MTSHVPTQSSSTIMLIRTLPYLRGLAHAPRRHLTVISASAPSGPHGNLHQSPRSQPSSPTPPSEAHTADTYSKDVDSTPPEDPTIHRVDSASESAQKPHEPPSGEFSRAGTKTKEYQK